MARVQYSKAPNIRTGHWAVLAVHSMYCRTGIHTDTYNRNFRVVSFKRMKIFADESSYLIRSEKYR